MAIARKSLMYRLPCRFVSCPVRARGSYMHKTATRRAVIQQVPTGFTCDDLRTCRVGRPYVGWRYGGWRYGVTGASHGQVCCSTPA